MTGRKIICTSILPKSMQWHGYFGSTLDSTTLPDMLKNALGLHKQNATEIHRLMEYYKGNQPILQRSDDNRNVNNKIAINYALSTTRDIVGYAFGEPIQYMHKQQDYMADVQVLNSCMFEENKVSIDMMVAIDQSICGTAYKGIFPDISVSGIVDNVPFKLIHYDPMTTFVAYSTYNVTKAVYACVVNSITDIDGNSKTIYNVYTVDTCYVYVVPNQRILLDCWKDGKILKMKGMRKMKLQELLGDKYKDELTAKEIAELLQNKDLADLSSGEYLPNNKYQELDKKYKELEKMNKEKLTEEEQRRLKDIEAAEEFKSLKLQNCKLLMEKELRTAGFEDAELDELLKTYQSDDSDNAIAFAKNVANIRIKDKEKIEQKLKQEYMSNMSKPNQSPNGGLPQSKSDLDKMNYQELNNFAKTNPELFAQLVE